MNQKTLVEVSVPDRDGTMIPFGIMNCEQAKGLPDDYEVMIAHPAADMDCGFGSDVGREPISE